MRKLPICATTLALAALAAWVALGSGPALPAPVASLVGSAAPGSASFVVDAAAGDATVRTEVPAAEPMASVMTLRGRCVDARGTPIVGVTAKLSSQPTTTKRMEAWCAQNPMPGPIAEQRNTGADGVFEFRFFPPPPFQFSFTLGKHRHVPASRHWPELEPGTTKDLGDVVMPSGTILHGRVVDTEGMPVVGASVRFTRLGGTSGIEAAQTSDHGQAGRGGTFFGRTPLVAGEYSLEVIDRRLVRPTQIQVSGDPTDQFVEVVLAPIGPTVTLSGVVVDEEGAPIRGVPPRPLGSGVSFSLSLLATNSEGRFCVTRPDTDDSDTVALHLDSPGFEVLTVERVAWGRQDLRLVLRRALEVEVAVLASGVAVGDYAVRILGGGSGLDSEVRARGKIGETPVVVRGVRRGRRFVVVDPAGDVFARAVHGPLDLVGPGRTRVTVTLNPVARRTLRVQWSDGTPVVGVTVYLVDPLDTVGAVEICPPDGMYSSAMALRLQWLATDARGEAQLSGPSGRALAISLSGTELTPTWVSDVRLDVEAPLIVEVAPGARQASGK